jgi:hypothetical protein
MIKQYRYKETIMEQVEPLENVEINIKSSTQLLDNLSYIEKNILEYGDVMWVYGAITVYYANGSSDTPKIPITSEDYLILT